MEASRRWNLVVIVALSASAISAAEPVQSRDRPRSGILADALDFKQPPTLPEIEEPTAEQLEASINRNVEFLLRVQNANGAWGSATKTKGLNIYAPVPGSHYAFRADKPALLIWSKINSFQ